MATGGAEKASVLTSLAQGRRVERLPKHTVRIGTSAIHVRFRTKSKSGSIWSYNVNPNTLRADYELLICGSPECYFLIPVSRIREIYDNPRTYPDRLHSRIKVLEVNTKTHMCRFGSAGLQMDFTAYYCARL
jgi:hypothetical protein